MLKHALNEARENPALVPLASVGLTKGLWEVAVKPFFQEHPGAVGWGATLTAVGMYDAWALSTKHETMSQAFRTAYEHPIYKFMCIGALGGLAVHLLQQPNGLANEG